MPKKSEEKTPVAEISLNEPLIKKRFGKFIINKDASLAIFKQCYEATHDSEKKRSENKEVVFGIPEIQRTLDATLETMLKRDNYNAEECDQIIKAFEELEFEASDQNIKDYKNWEHRNTKVTDRADILKGVNEAGHEFLINQNISSLLEGHFNAVSQAVTTTLRKISDEKTNELINGYLIENASNAQQRKFNAILVRLGPEIGFSKDVQAHLNGDDAKALVAKIRDSYQTQYNDLLVYINKHLEALVIEIDQAKSKNKNISLLTAQHKGLLDLKKDMERKKNDSIGKKPNREITEVMRIDSYRCTLTYAYEFLTRERNIKIGDNDTKTSYLKLIQKNNNKLQGFFNAIVNKLSKLIGKPAALQVNMWNKQQSPQQKISQRVLKAATKDHVKTLEKKFGF